jgi:hypothetical protein
LSAVASEGIETLIGVRSRIGSPSSEPTPSRWLLPWISAPGHSSSRSGLNITIFSGVDFMLNVVVRQASCCDSFTPPGSSLSMRSVVFSGAVPGFGLGTSSGNAGLNCAHFGSVCRYAPTSC